MRSSRTTWFSPLVAAHAAAERTVHDAKPRQATNPNRRGANKKPVILGGRKYPTMTDACRAAGGWGALYRKLEKQK